MKKVLKPQILFLLGFLLVLAGLMNSNTTQAADFGIEYVNDTTGIVWFTDQGWTGGWNYVCLNGACYTGTNTNGRYERQFGNLSCGQSYAITLKVQDNSSGQEIIDQNVTFTCGTAVPTNTSAPTNTPEPTNTTAPTNTPQPTDPPPPTETPCGNCPTPTTAPTNTPIPTSTPAPTSEAPPFEGMALVEGGNGNATYIFELPWAANAIYQDTRINGAGQGFAQINNTSILKAATDDDPSVVYSWQSPYSFNGGEFCYRIQANGSGEAFLPGPGVPDMECFTEYTPTTPPSGNLNSPPSGPWSGSVEISGTASDDYGRPTVEVYIDGQLANTGVAQSNGSFEFDIVTNQGTGEQGNVSPNYPNGSYDIRVDVVGLLGGRVTIGSFTRQFNNSTFLPSVLTTEFAVRFRLRHEGEQNAPQSHDRFEDNYASGFGYYWGKITDYEDHVVIQAWTHGANSPAGMGNCVVEVRVDASIGGEVPAYTIGCPNVSPSDGADQEMHIYDVNGESWASYRQRKGLLTWEYTTGPWYSSIMRYRAGQGGFGWKYEDPKYHAEAPDFRYYTGGFASSNPVSGDGLEFSQEFMGINGPQMGNFLAGRVTFREDFPDDVGTGGPLYSGESCLSCHINATRGQAPTVGSNDGVGLIVRVADNNNPSQPHPEYGTHVDLDSINNGQFTEGGLSVTTSSGPNGTTALNYSLTNLAYGPATNFEVRMAPQLPGLGLLEAISDATIQSWADPNDANGDGISGRIHYVSSPSEGGTQIGRYGWKAGAATIEDQVAKAYNFDMGVVSAHFPTHDITQANINAGVTVPSGTEISQSEIDEVTGYILGLGIPVRRHPDVKYGLYGTGGGRLSAEPVTLSDPQIEQGEDLFYQIGCADCHKPVIETGDDHPYPQFRNQTIRAYTDLLLHDMGPDLAGLPEGNASATEWRTPPLWGTRLLERLQENSNFSEAQLPFTSELNKTSWLHDGRASSRDEAIRWHGGEAAQSRNDYLNLSQSERDALIRYLQSL